MELAALIVAVLAFGWAVMLIGAPLFVGTVVVLAVVRLWELVRSRWEQRRATRWDQTAALPEGLMSGFFAVSAVPEQPPLPPVDLPILRTARNWAEGTARNWAEGAARHWPTRHWPTRGSVAQTRAAASRRPAGPVRCRLPLADRLRPPR